VESGTGSSGREEEELIAHVLTVSLSVCHARRHDRLRLCREGRGCYYYHGCCESSAFVLLSPRAEFTCSLDVGRAHLCVLCFVIVYRWLGRKYGSYFLGQVSEEDTGRMQVMLRPLFVRRVRWRKVVSGLCVCVCVQGRQSHELPVRPVCTPFCLW